MTDTAAIRARHVRFFDGTIWRCVDDKKPWGEAGCDAHQLGVALADCEAHNVNSTASFNADLEAAEAREQRLRAALRTIRDDELSAPHAAVRLRDIARAALATEAE